MNHKLTSAILITALFIGVFTLIAAKVNAEGLKLFCSEKQIIKVTLNNNANIDKSKTEISKVSQVKIIKITDRDKEWSRMVNKMDLPKMENPFKNEIIIKTKKNANADEICNQVKSMNFVENAEIITETQCAGK